MKNIDKNVDKILETLTFKSQSGKEIIWTPGQKEMVGTILNRQSPDGKKRIHIMTATRYGKSASVAAAVLTRVAIKPEKWAIVAGTKDKAAIIMEYIAMYALDNPLFRDQLELETGGLERLRRERSRDRLTFKRRGEVRVYSADARNKRATGESLMGFGAPNVVEDESALMDDDIHTKAMRMLGDSPDNFLVKIGNPFNRNHFLKSYRNPAYHKIEIDYRQATKEGRLTSEYVEEMRKEAMFDILYEVKFPDADMIDEQGYMPLITEAELKRAKTKVKMYHFGEKRIGSDVAGGGKNFSILLVRSSNYAEIDSKDRSDDTMALVGRGLRLRKRLGRDDRGKLSKIFTDRVGVGKGSYDRYREQIEDVVGVVGGSEPANPARFSNKRAENYWRGREWLLGGGKLEDRNEWDALLDIRYKIVSGQKIKLMTKEEMIRKGIDSPDIPDAWANTFNDFESTPGLEGKAPPTEKKSKDMDPYIESPQESSPGSLQGDDVIGGVI